MTKDNDQIEMTFEDETALDDKVTDLLSVKLQKETEARMEDILENGFTTPEECLEEAIKMVKDHELKSVLVIALDDQGDTYHVAHGPGFSKVLSAYEALGRVRMTLLAQMFGIF